MAGDRAKRQLAAWKRQGRTESVIYRPGSGRPRRIDVVVKRQGIVDDRGKGVPRMTVKALNDEQDGIPATLDKGLDEVAVAEMPGGTLVDRHVRQTVGVDPDWVTVEVG